MMTSAETLIAKTLMCENTHCSSCPLSALNNGENDDCNLYILDHPDRALVVIEDWYKEHNGPTNAEWWASKLRELGSPILPFVLASQCPRIFNGEGCPDEHEPISFNKACENCKRWWYEQHKEA